MKTNRWFLALLMLAAVTIAANAQSKQWLHVRVETPKKGGETIKVNVPLSLAETVLPMINEKEFSEGKIRIDEKDISVAELRNIWAAVKAEGDAEYVTVETEDTNLRVALQGQYLIVRTDEQSKSQVEISLPVAVVDALLSAEGEHLDLVAAIRALSETGPREIVSIKDKETTVRVWIDEKNTDQ